MLRTVLPRASGSRPALPRLRGDLLPAALLAVAAVAGTALAAGGQSGRRALDPVAVLLVVAAALAWSVRTSWPVGALAAVTAVTAGYVVAGFPYGPIQLFVVLVSF